MHVLWGTTKLNNSQKTHLIQILCLGSNIPKSALWPIIVLTRCSWITTLHHLLYPHALTNTSKYANTNHLHELSFLTYDKPKSTTLNVNHHTYPKLTNLHFQN